MLILAKLPAKVIILSNQSFVIATHFMSTFLYKEIAQSLYGLWALPGDVVEKLAEILPCICNGSDGHTGVAKVE